MTDRGFRTIPTELQDRIKTDIDRLYLDDRSEVFTAVTMENAVFWDIRTQFIPHRRHYISATDLSGLMLCQI
jgi:hypothetical protein